MILWSLSFVLYLRVWKLKKMHYNTTFEILIRNIFGNILFPLSLDDRKLRGQSELNPCDECPPDDLRLTGLPAKSPCEGKRNWGPLPWKRGSLPLTAPQSCSHLPAGSGPRVKREALCNPTGITPPNNAPLKERQKPCIKRRWGGARLWSPTTINTDSRHLSSLQEAQPSSPPHPRPALPSLLQAFADSVLLLPSHL